MMAIRRVGGGGTHRLVFEALRVKGCASRAELAKITGLSPPTVGKVADDLVARGLLQEEETAGEGGGPPLVGRPSRPLRLNTSAARLVALQIGVRHTRLAALPVAGPEDVDWPVQFETPARRETFVARLKVAASELRVKEPWGVTVSVPGVVDEAGKCLLSPNMRWLQDMDLRELVAETWKAPVVLLQEIQALALGQLSAEPALTDFLLVDFGEGVGGSIVTEGRVFRGPLPLSGELGHARVAGNKRPCGCGAVGCLETLAARKGMVMSFWQAHRDLPATWGTLSAYVQEHGIEPWLAEALEASGAVIGAAMNLVGIKHVVVTGALTELPAEVIESLGESVRASAMWARFGEVTVTAAPRRRAAGLVVAAVDQLLLGNNDVKE